MAAEYQSWSDEYGEGVIPDGGGGASPGGFVFGVTGWRWPQPVPTSVTFYHDGTAGVFDQHGRAIKGVVTPNGESALFAACPPRADGTDATTRLQFARHARVVEVLAGEGVDLIAHMNNVDKPCQQCKGTGKGAGDKGCRRCHHQATGKPTGREPVVVCSGWPQLKYDQLKQLKNARWPFSAEHVDQADPTGQACRCARCCIKDQALLKDALRFKAEQDAARNKAMAEV